MLFDLRGRRRRRGIQAIYLSLAILMGGGLVFFGIGGNTSGGLVDALNSGGGGGGAGTFEDRAKKAQESTTARPRDARAWATLAKARYQLAGVGENYDQATGTFTAKGNAQLRQAVRAWERHVALKPPRVDANLATLITNAYISLNAPDKAVATQEIVVERQTASTGQYSKLAQLAYAAGQTRKGDLAAARAVELAPADQRTIVKDALAEAKTQGAAGAAGGAGAAGAGGAAPGTAAPTP